MLQKAGFQSRTPTTAQQKAAYAKLPANELHQVTWKGRTLYGYKDEKAGVVWVGNEAQYAQYKQLATNAKLSQDQITPAQAALEAKDVHTYNSGMTSHSVGRRRGQRPRLSLLVWFLEGLWCREAGRLDIRKGVPPRQ